MKKNLLIVLCITVFLVLGTSVCYAADTITENPKIKIIIDGKPGVFSNVPVIVNGRTLLPFREVLKNLGVLDDDQHIIWNGTDKSITINKDSTKISLQIGSINAYVNDEPVTIDVAPVIYMNRTYIPARFISQSLGMRVGWDPISATILLKNEADYNSVKDTLDKAIEAMNSLEKLKIAETGKAYISASGLKITSTINYNTMLDKKNKFSYSVIDSTLNDGSEDIKDKIETFSDGVTGYIKMDGAWKNSALGEDEIKDMFAFTELLSDDILCAGLSVDNSSQGDTIVLKGNINLKDYSDGFFELQDIKNYSFNSVNVEISIDKNTNYINKISMKAVVVTKDDENTEINVEMETVYTDFNGIFEVKAPDGLAVG